MQSFCSFVGWKYKIKRVKIMYRYSIAWFWMTQQRIHDNTLKKKKRHFIVFDVFIMWLNKTILFKKKPLSEPDCSIIRKFFCPQKDYEVIFKYIQLLFFSYQMADNLDSLKEKKKSKRGRNLLRCC